MSSSKKAIAAVEAPETRPGDVIERGLERWRLSRPDIDSSAKGIVGRIIRLQDFILQEVNEALAPFRLRYHEYAVIATLRVAPAPHQMSPRELLQSLLFTSGGLSLLISRLEQAGHVERLRDPRDGRGVIVRLTPEGKRLADEAMPVHAAAEHRLIAMLDADEKAAMARSLRAMLEPHERQP